MMQQPSVGLCAGIETVLGKNIISGQFTSVQEISKIYCEIQGVPAQNLESISIPEMISCVRTFFQKIGSEPNPDRKSFPHTPKTISIPLLMQIETMIGIPFYDPAFDLGKITTQLVCVECGYGLAPDEMGKIRNMPYPDYLADVWIPLYRQLYAALVPPQEIERADDIPEKNQYPLSTS